MRVIPGDSLLNSAKHRDAEPRQSKISKLSPYLRNYFSN
jgi:hypothetical protein